MSDEPKPRAGPSEMPLGRTSEFPDRYRPDLLFAIDRSTSRCDLGWSAAPPFSGVDRWTAWELAWLDADGRPKVGVAQLEIPAISPNLVESKSLKLYLHSLNDERLDSPVSVAQRIRRDVGEVVGAAITVDVLPPQRWSFESAMVQGHCLDGEPVSPDIHEVDPGLLRSGGPVVDETLYSHAVRTFCPVTGQPDWATIIVSYRGERIDSGGLASYLVSYRNHQGFHESCVERIYRDLWVRCQPERLSVHGCFTRRGGIDINPFRASHVTMAPTVRIFRQ